jgi:hypothetical protein
VRVGRKVNCCYAGSMFTVGCVLEPTREEIIILALIILVFVL